MRNFVQDTYLFRSATIGKAGQLSDVSLRNVESFAAESIILYGVAVKRGTDPQQQVLPWRENDAAVPFLGVSVATFSNGPTVLNPVGDSYLTGESVNVLTFGKILVDVGVNVIAGQKAYLVVSADVALAGKFTNVALNNVLVGKFTSTATAGTLAELEIK